MRVKSTYALLLVFAIGLPCACLEFPRRQPNPEPFVCNTYRDVRLHEGQRVRAAGQLRAIHGTPARQELVLADGFGLVLAGSTARPGSDGARLSIVGTVRSECPPAVLALPEFDYHAPCIIDAVDPRPTSGP
ncbi:MAG: hypothetical protein KDK35_12550 [Leptospiraceae bacterium]|nr:hypothetical protein [Leptospiraceae bacterium]